MGRTPKKQIGRRWLGTKKISGKDYQPRGEFKSQAKAQEFAKELRLNHRARVIPVANLLTFNRKTGKYEIYEKGFQVFYRSGKKD